MKSEKETKSETAEAPLGAVDLQQKLLMPIHAIIGFTEGLARRPSSAHDAGDLQQILRCARELRHLVESEFPEPEERAPEAVASAPQPAPAPPRAPATAPTPALAGSSCDVLYIEDEIVIFTLVEHILRFRPGVTLKHAALGKVGIQLAAQHQPKLILLDLSLPDMNGAHVLQRLQQQPATAGIPVVILSGNHTPSEIERLLTAGARNYLTKPFDVDPVLALIDEYVVEPSVAASLELVS